MTASSRAWLQLHFCVVLWGFTAILGKLISLQALPLVWWRMLIVCLALACIPRVWRGARDLSLRQLGIFALIGLCVSVHWITFYASIKLANASVGATCMALNPVFLAFIEPWIARRRFAWSEALLGLCAVLGVALVVGGTPSGMHAGIAVGVLSSLCVAIFSALNKRYAVQSDALVVTAVEMGAGVSAITLCALVPGVRVWVQPGAQDLGLLLILGIGLTLLPYALSLVILRHLSAFSTMLAVNLEPLYSIVLAMWFFGEQRELNATFYLGALIILGSVLSYPWFSRPRSLRPAEPASPR